MQEAKQQGKRINGIELQSDKIQVIRSEATYQFKRFQGGLSKKETATPYQFMMTFSDIINNTEELSDELMTLLVITYQTKRLRLYMDRDSFEVIVQEHGCQRHLSGWMSAAAFKHCSWDDFEAYLDMLLYAACAVAHGTQK